MIVADLKVGDVFEVLNPPNAKEKIFGYMKGPLQVILNNPANETICTSNVSGKIVYVSKSRPMIRLDVIPEEFENIPLKDFPENIPFILIDISYYSLSANTDGLTYPPGPYIKLRQRELSPNGEILSLCIDSNNKRTEFLGARRVEPIDYFTEEWEE